MKQIIWSILLSAALLLAGLAAGTTMENIHTPLASMAQQAEEAALEENWQQAVLLTRTARQEWEKSRVITAIFADHGPMEEIDALFAELEIYGELEEKPHFAALCSRLQCQLRAMAQAHTADWWNVL